MKKTTKAQAWENAVRQARQYIQKYDKVRWTICEFALNVCDISHGGRKTASTWTVTKFAKEIDLHPKTLAEWIRVKKLVLDKLPKAIRDSPNEYAYETYKDVVSKVTPDSTPLEVKSFFMEKTNQTPEIKKFIRYKKHLHSIMYNCSRPFLMKDIPEDLLKDYIQLMNTIIGLLNTEVELRERFIDHDAQTRKRLNMKLKEIK